MTLNNSVNTNEIVNTLTPLERKQLRAAAVAKGILPAKSPVEQDESLTALQRKQLRAAAVARGLLPAREPITLPNLERKGTDISASVATGIGQGLADLARGGYHTATELYKGLAHFLPEGKLKQSLIEMPPTPPRVDVSGYVTRKHPELDVYSHPIAKGIGEFVPKLASVLLMPEVPAGEALGLGAEGAGVISNLARRVLTEGATGGLQTEMLADPSQQGSAALLGTALGGGLGLAGGIAPEITQGVLNRIIEAAARGQKVKTPVQTLKRLKVLRPLFKGQLPISLGDLTGYQPLSQFYHETLGNLWWLPAKKKGQMVLDKARDVAGNIVNTLKGKIKPEKINDELQSALTMHYENQHTNAMNAYNELFNLADHKGLKIEPENVIKTTKEILASQKKEGKIPDLSSQLRNDLKDALEKRFIIKSKKGLIIDPETKQPFTTKDRIAQLDLHTLHDNRSTYGSKAIKAQKFGEGKDAAAYFKLRDAALQDLKKSVRLSNNDDLLDKMLDIDKQWQTHVVPYESDTMKKLMYATDFPEKIEKTLLNPKKYQIIKHFTPEQRNLILYKRLSNAIEKEGMDDLVTNPFKLIRYFDKKTNLSPTQKDLLLNNRPIRKEFKKLRVLAKMSREPALAEERRATGFRNVGKFLGGLPWLAAGTGLFEPVKSAIGLLGYGALTKGIEKALTSEWLRKAYTTGELPRLLSGRGNITKLLRSLGAIGIGKGLS